MVRETFIRVLYRAQQRIGLTAPEFRAVCVFLGLLVAGSVAEHTWYRTVPLDPETKEATDAYFRERALAAGLGPFSSSPPPDTAVSGAAYGATSVGADTTLPKVRRDSAGTVDADPSTADGRIDVNVADETTLQVLPGIGPALARRIVDFRKRNGPYRFPEDLLMIRGIGEKTLTRLLPRISLDGVPPPSEPG